MPLTELDPNSSGRNSRASDVSRRPKNVPRRTSSGTTDMLSNNPSIYGMLKTTTETGDLGLLSMRSSRLPAIPKGKPRKAVPFDLSRTPSHYSYSHSHHESIHSRRTSGYSGGDTSLLAPRNPYVRLQGLQSPPSSGSRSTPTSESHKSLTTHVRDGLESKRRSYSLTSQPLPPLPYHRSLTSLRGSATSVKSRSPNAYPIRLRRPGFRPDSPALSDITGLENRYGDRLRQKYGPRSQSASPYMLNNKDNKLIKRDNNPPTATSIGGLNEHTEATPPIKNHKVIPVAEFLNSGQNEIASSPASASEPLTFREQVHSELSSKNPVQPQELDRGQEADAMSHSALSSMQIPGFVQRVKTILEEKISQEKYEQKAPESKMSDAPIESAIEIVELPASPVRRCRQEVLELVTDSRPEAVGSLPDGADTIDAIVFFQQTPASARFSQEDSRAEDLPSGSPSTKRLTPSPSESPTFTSSPEVYPHQDDLTIRFSIPGSFPISVQDKNAFIETPGKFRHRATPDIIPNDAQLTANVCTGNLSEETIREIEDAIRSQNTSEISSRLERKARNYGQGLDTESAISAKDFTRGHQLAPQIFVSSATTSTNDSVDAGHPDILLQSMLASTSSPSPSQLPSSDRELASQSNRTSDNSYSSFSEDTQSKFQLSSKSTKSGHTSRRTSSVPEIFLFAESDADAVQTQDRLSNRETKFSGFKPARSTLPDLTEDSQEDASATNLRILGSRYIIPRTAIGKPFREKAILPRHNSGTIKIPASYLTRSITGDFNMPTLNFSRMDLLSKLNLALGLLSSRSLEDLRSTNVQDLSGSIQERSASSDMVRDAHNSLFSINSVSATDGENFSREKQVRSIAEELITEINRLSIPSVSGLTQRLSDLLPTIKHTDLTGDGSERLVSFGSSTDLQTSARPSTLLSASSECKPPSTVMEEKWPRPVTEPVVAPIGTDSPSRSTSALRLMKELPPLPTEITYNRSSISTGVILRRNMENSSESNQRMIIAELEASSSHPAAKSQNMKFARQSLNSSKRANMETRQGQALEGSPPGSRPWNLDENYTWSEGSPSVEIIVPHGIMAEAAVGWKQRRDRLKRSKSASDLAMPFEDTVRIARSMSPGPVFHANLVPRTETVIETEKPGIEKKSILGSISRKMGIRPKVDKAGFPLDPEFLHPEDRPLNPGDRYPTSSLSPINGMMNMEEARSYFSDDSSPSEHLGSETLRKRITRLKPKLSALRGVSPRESRSDVQRMQDDSILNETTRDLNLEETVPNGHNPPGMSKVEFRAKRMVEKLRNLWFRSGELIRNMSRTKKQVPSWYEDGDMYSGV